jgi:hypothetical protein
MVRDERALDEIGDRRFILDNQESHGRCLTSCMDQRATIG